MEHTSSENILDALKLLEEAAKQKKDELMAVMSDKYTHLRSLIMEKDSVLKSLHTHGDCALKAVGHIRDAGCDKARELARDVDDNVRSNPWLYIAGTAGVGLLFGFILGRSRK